MDENDHAKRQQLRDSYTEYARRIIKSLDKISQKFAKEDDSGVPVDQQEPPSLKMSKLRVTGGLIKFDPEEVLQFLPTQAEIQQMSE